MSHDTATRSMTARRAMKIIALATIGLLLAACTNGANSSGGSATGSSPTESSAVTGKGNPTATTRGVTSTSVTVGGIASLTSARSATLPGSDIGARAYFARVNGHGGVDGRKINFIGVSDDGDHPTKNLQVAQQLVQQSHVFGLVPVLTADMGSAPFLDAAHVPTVGELYDAAACQRTYVFGISGCTSPPPGLRVFSPAPGLVLKQGVFRGASGRTVAITMDDDPVGHASAQACTGPFTSSGFKVVLENLFVPVAPAVTDYAPYVQQLIHSDHGSAPEVIWTCNSFSNALGIINALKSAGYHGVIYSPVGYDPRLLQVPPVRDALQGAYIYTMFEPVEATTPALRQVRADVQAVDPSAELSTEVLAGYYAAEMFVDILKKAGKDLTAQRFAQAANAGFSFDAGGGLCAVTFPLGHTLGMVGGGLVQVNGNQFKVVVPLLCQPMSANVRY